MTAVATQDQHIADFARHLRLSSPFESNRVCDASQAMPPSVPAIHAVEYEELASLVQRVNRGKTGVGAMLWGEAGVGKSHLLARLWHDLRSRACVTYLHNVQASPERLPRYVLKCVLGQVAHAQTGLHDGKLNYLMAAAVRQTLGSSAPATMSEAHTAFKKVYVTPAITAGRPDAALVHEFLFAYFRSIFRAEKKGASSLRAAELAIRWLSGDTLDKDEIDAVGLTPEMRGRAVEVLPDDQAVEAVLGAISRLAHAARCTFVIMFDQVDNLSEEQVSAWARFAHALIDDVPNLLVITSGVRGRLLEMQQSSIVNAASWDRIAQHRIEIGRITPDESRELLEARLASFVEPFLGIPEIQDRISEDGLFPLGCDWLNHRVGNALDVRPRDVINWAHDRFRDLGREISQAGCEEWLANWPGVHPGDVIEPLPLTDDQWQVQIDETIEDKLVEQRRRRRLNPDTLPADAGNLLGLIENLLTQCVDTQHGYSLRSATRVNRTKKAPSPAYDLIVEEQTPDGTMTSTGIKFVTTGSKVSAYAMLRRLEAVEDPPQHTLLVTEERCPLQLGPKGKERLSRLESRGEDAFDCHELSFETHCQLDALQAVIGLGNSGDLEVRVAGGVCEPLEADKVIDSHHRCDRYRAVSLLQELLTEESVSSKATPAPRVESVAPEQQLQDFVLRQLADAGSASTQELSAKYVTAAGLDASHTDAVCDALDRVVIDLHRAGKVSAAAQDDHTFVSMPQTAAAGGNDADEGNGQITPVHFTVTQVRQAAACPRLLLFDAEYTRTRKLTHPRVTRIWQNSDPDEVGALGTLFHQAVEKFNDAGAQCRKLRTLLESRPDGLVLPQALHDLIVLHANKKRLHEASLRQRNNFAQALRCYTAELAEILEVGLEQHGAVGPVMDHMFGDRRKLVDVTFHVGPSEQKVHVTGRLDYVFYDWRRDGHRIMDYKLTPGMSVDADLYQVCVYALMHHQQHGTKPDVALLYLYPHRMMREMSWQEVFDRRHEIYDLLASMVQWRDFQTEPPRGLHPPGNSAYCFACRYSQRCRSQLGAVGIGDRSRHWIRTADSDCPVEPVVHRIAVSQVPAKEPVTLPEVTTVAEIEKRVDDAVELAEPLASDDVPTCAANVAAELFLGNSCDGDAITLPLDKLPSHVALVGAAGSGKTWMAKVIAEEAVQQGVPILAIDPQGDLVQFLRQNGSSKEGQTAHDRYWQRVEPRVFTPGSSHGTRLSIDPIRIPSPNDLSKIDNEARRVEEQQSMLSATVTNLVNLAKAGGDTDMQRTFMMQVVRSLMTNRPDGGSQLPLRDIASAIMAPENAGLDDPDIYLPKSQREKLGRKVMTMLKGPQAKLFRGGTPIDIDAFCRPSRNGKIPLNVIYLNALTSDEEKQFFVASLATELYRWMVSSLESSGQAKLLFYLDEARDFIPAGGRKPLAKEPLIRMFSQGRKYGVSCLICTQSPRSVDYNIFSNCSTKLIGRLESAQDVERVAEWFSTDGGRPRWLGKRKAAGRGTFVARWPDMPASLTGVEFKGRPLFSMHEGAWSPDRVERESKKVVV